MPQKRSLVIPLCPENKIAISMMNALQPNSIKNDN